MAGYFTKQTQVEQAEALGRMEGDFLRHPNRRFRGNEAFVNDPGHNSNIARVDMQGPIKAHVQSQQNSDNLESDPGSFPSTIPKRPHRPTLDAKNRDEDIDDSAKKPRRPNGQDGDENPDDPVPGPSGLQADRRRGRPEDSPIRPEPQDGDQNPDQSPAPGSEEFKAFYAAHHPSQKAKQPPQGGDQNLDDPVPGPSGLQAPQDRRPEAQGGDDDPVPGPSGLQAPQDRRPQAQGGDDDPVPGPSGLQAKQPSTSGPLDVQGRPRNRGSSPSLREQLARDHPRADQLALPLRPPKPTKEKPTQTPPQPENNVFDVRSISLDEFDFF